MKGKSALTLLLAGIFSCGTCQATGAEVTSESVFNILNSTGAATDKSYLSLNPDKYPNYRLLIHSAKKKNEIKKTKKENRHYDERDSTVTKDSTIVYLKIDADGKIKTIKKEKII